CSVGIDMIAGPSEILLVSDNQNKPEHIAVDLLSQAEHDPEAQSILITNDKNFAKKVEHAIDQQLLQLPRRQIASASWKNWGAIILVKDFEQAPDLINKIAPEHLELAIENPSDLAEKINHAGAIFLGRYTPEAIGDYIAGPNHVLPTSRAARFSSGLSVFDFLKRTSLIECTQSGLNAIGPAASLLAECECLDAHALSITQRLNALD
ncbi:MAG: histidinol dehydrogenase, partial [Pseudomonadota bacterium]